MSELDDAAFRRLAELAPDAMLAHRDGRVIWANEAGAALAGLPGAADAVGRPVMDFVAPESRPAVAARVARMLATGQPEPVLEERFLRFDDARRVAVEVAAAPIGGGVVLVVVRDVERRREAERQREEALRRWRAFFQASSDAILVVAGDTIVEANAAFARLTGHADPEELVGRHALELVAPEDRPRVAENVRRRLGGQPFAARYQVRALRRDGQAYEADLIVQPTVESGEDRTLVLARDVTAERAARDGLAASEARYRALFHGVPVGVWEEDLSGVKRILDGLRAEGVGDLAAHFRSHPEVLASCAMSVKVLDVNATALAMTGARDKDELLANLHRIFLPESLEDFGQELLQLAEGRRETVTEGWNGTLDGRRLWVAVRGVLAAGHEHDWSRLLVTTADITERRRAREERAQLQDRLRHAEKLEAVGRLAGGVAHDFNNILSAVLGFAEVSLEATAPGTDLHENQLRIREAAQRARDLVQQILTFGKRDRPEQRPVDVAAVVGEALALARAGIPAGVALAARLDPAAGSALADPSQLHQIVLNLCSNARDAVGEHGRIEVEVTAEHRAAAEPDLAAGDWIRLRVRDDGVGMDEATRGRLFEPYMTTKGRSGGHGLGLAVVHGIVGGCGGAVRVESAPGQGSTFDVWLPRLAASARPEAVAGPPPRGSARVLLVDDEPLVRAAHRRVLGSLGYAVIEARDGAEALEMARATPDAFDLVLTDETMPRLSGTELARTLLAERPGIRVVLCTGYSDALDEAQVRALGLRGLLAKPFGRAALATALQRALDDLP